MMVFAIFLFCTETLQSQNLFQNQNLLSDQKFRSGLVVGVADMNGDFVDDIVRLNRGQNLSIEFGNGSDHTFLQVYPGVSTQYSPWSMTIGDIDNDGNNDIVIGGNRTGIYVWNFGENGIFEKEVRLENDNFYVQATNLVDINNDGWLDLFVCNDEGISHIYANDGAGNLHFTEEWIDLKTAVPSDNSGNYGSLWTDIDMDGDLDLYISKCKAGVEDPADPRRINQLFINDGNNQYTEKGAEWGLAIGDQSWISDFGDVDNDGDMDCLILNHDVTSKLMINQGDTFYNYTDSMGVQIEGPLFQCFFEDIDNDGRLDILIGGVAPYVYLNRGNYQFQPFSDLEAPEVMTSLSVGDFNRDGFIDIYGIYSRDFVDPGSQDDLMWLNRGNNNYYLDIQLVGTTSNYNAVGATIFCYGAWGKQVREIRSGESYGITASSIAHFGLGNDSQIDSLVVLWPSGIKEAFNKLAANQKLLIIEKGCISQSEFSENIGSFTFCNGDSLQMVINSSDPAVWNTGDTSNEYTIKESGIYFAKINKGNGCFDLTPSIRATVDPDETPTILLLGDSVLCAGEEIVLNLPSATQYLWNIGAEEQSITVDQSGSYYATIKGLCADFNSDTVSIRFLNPETPIAEDVEITNPGPVSLTAIGDSLHWYQMEESDSTLFSGPILEIDSVSHSRTWYVSNVNTFEGDTLTIGETEPKGIELYNNNNFNGRMFFNVYRSLFLESVIVYTDSPGTRIIEVVKDGERLISKEFDLDTGKTVLNLNFFLEPGDDYYLSTNSALNRENYGSSSPRLWRTSLESLAYPYGDPSSLQITRTNFTEQEYYYFYNWQIKIQDRYCESARVPLHVEVKSTSIDELSSNGYSIYPNPAAQVITIHSEAEKELDQIRIYTIHGKLVLSQNLDYGKEVNIDQLPPGPYVYRIFANHEYAVGKLIKQ